MPLTAVSAEAERAYVRDLPERIGDRVTLNGWVAGIKRAKTVTFVEVRDRGGTVQAVYRDPNGLPVTPGSAVKILGTAREPNDPRFGRVEVEIERLQVISEAEALPLEPNADPEERLDRRYLDLRSREKALIFEVQSTLELALREYAISRSFLELHSPKISAGGSESGATVFELPYFGETVCLVQSAQFYMQMAMAAELDRVFEIGPVFRNEPGVTPRHATEFTIAHYEMSWLDSHEDLMAFEEDLLRYALSVVEDVHGDEIERWCGVRVEVPPKPIPRIPLSAAPELAEELTNGIEGKTSGRLLAKAEQALSKYAQQAFGHSWVFITGYRHEDRPFYTMHDDDNPGESRSFDLLWRGMELTSGGQREHRYDRLQLQMADAGLERRVIESYLEPHFLEMFRYGCPPHGGFGIGINRLLMALLGQPSIRETTYVFRGPGRYLP